MRKLMMLTLMWLCAATPAWTQCGGVERWAVKMAADPGASQINLTQPVTTSLHDLVRLSRPTLPNDDMTRAAAERIVRRVDGRLVKFKEERGKTGDSDFHLVITDETLLYSPGGTNSTTSAHSFIAEIPRPECVAGRHGTVTGTSVVQAQLASTRNKFLQRFPNITSGWNDAGGRRVRLTGVAFFDRAHGQVGRALNGIELHPLIDIEFDPPAAATTAVELSLPNADFENGATQDWTATAGVITNHPNQPAHSGNWKAWLAGYGETHTDRLARRVTLPATAATISLTFHLHIETEEEGQVAYDRLRVRVRNSSGQFMATPKTFTNLDAASGFVLHSIDLTSYKGMTIRIELEAQEDMSSATSFVLDDFKIIIEN